MLRRSAVFIRLALFACEIRPTGRILGRRRARGSRSGTPHFSGPVHESHDLGRSSSRSRELIASPLATRRFAAPAIVLAAVIGVALAQPVTAQQAPVTECDRLAADPDDPASVAPGVEGRIPREAVAACRSAVAAHPDVPRFRYQLARSWAMSGGWAEENLPEMLSLVERLKDEGYRPARYLLVQGYEVEARLAARTDGPFVRRPQFDKVVAEYEGLIELGESRAAFELGEFYRRNPCAFPGCQAFAVRRELTRTAAEAGYPPAQYRYAEFVNDRATKAEWVRKAAEQGFRSAQIELASLYRSGEGVPRDLEAAARWEELALYSDDELAARRAEEQGARQWIQRGANPVEVPVTDCDRQAAHPLDPNRVADGVPAGQLSNAYGIHTICERALELYPSTPRLQYQQARASAVDPAETRDMSAQCPAGVRKSRCTVLEKDMATLRELADDGYDAAAYTLASIYRRLGQADSARREYERLADLGDPVGMTGLAELLDAEDRSADAVPLYRGAAEQGLAIAQSALGFMYLNGRGVNADAEEAARWFLRAAEQDEPMAQTHLGFLYREGRGVPPDTARAIEMFRRAVERPHWGPQVRLAAAQLGWAYVEGRGVPRDLEEGYRWLFHAGRNGDHRAGIHAAVMAAKGEGTEQKEDWARVQLAVIEKSGENPVEDRQLAAAIRDELCADEPANAMGCSDAQFPWEQEVRSRGVDAGTLLLGIALLGLLLDGGSGNDAGPHTYGSQCNVYSATDPCSPVYWEMANMNLP